MAVRSDVVRPRSMIHLRSQYRYDFPRGDNSRFIYICSGFKQFDICLKFAFNLRYRCSVLSLFHITIEAAVWLSYCEKKSLVFIGLPQDLRTKSFYGSRIVANAYLLRNSHELFRPQENRKADS